MASERHPQLRDEHAPLDQLIRMAIVQSGDTAPDIVAEDMYPMFLGFANEIVEDVRSHRYWDGEPVDYYKSMHEARPIPDTIMQTGLWALYQQQQLSGNQANRVMRKYRLTMGQVLWNRLNGNKATAIRMRPVDGGSRRADSPKTDPITGLPLSDVFSN